MKKLQLKALELGARELLSREQLKNVLGGNGSGSDDSGGSAGAKCTAKCGDSSVSITCKGSCSATDNVGVECTEGSTTTSKSCMGAS